MAQSDGDSDEDSASSDAGVGLASTSARLRPNSSEVLKRAGPTQPLNPNAEHQQRLNEALVRQEETKALQADDDRELRKRFAIWITIAAGMQIAAADVVFVIYATTNSWVIPGSTMSAWLGATVVQVIAVAVVIVRSLFPPQPK